MSDKPIPPSLAQHALQTCLSENGEQIGMAATIAQQAELIRLQAEEIARLSQAPVQHPDSAAVDRFAYEMKMKMAASRDKGRSGWDDKTRCTDRHLASLLVKHLTKGNPGTFVDIANFAMMLHQRSANPRALQIAALKQAGVAMEPSFYWVAADEGSYGSPEEWAQDYYDYNGEKPESVTLSCAVELPTREYDSFEFDDSGTCIGMRLVSPAEVARLNASRDLVPDEYRMVPIEPTMQMRRAAQDKLSAEGLIVSDWMICTAYAELLAAAPTPAPANELTNVRCQCCQSEHSHDSYDAGFIAGSGMCQVCDAAMPPKDLPAIEVWMIPAAKQLEQALESVPSFHDLSAELIAPAMLEHLRSAIAAGEYGDPYQGAREYLAIWKRRALEGETKIRKQDQIIENLGEALNAENGPTFMGEPVLPAHSADDLNMVRVPRDQLSGLLDYADILLVQLDGAYLYAGSIGNSIEHADEDYAQLRALLDGGAQ